MGVCGMRNTIIHGDCLDVMASIPDGSVDMILADLPYGVTSNHWDSVIPLEPLWAHYWRVLPSTGIVALTASQPFTSLLVMSQAQHFKHEWIWQKNQGGNFANTVREPFKEHESIVVFSRGKWTYNKQPQARSCAGMERARYGYGESSISKSANYRSFTRVHAIQDAEYRVPSSVQLFNVERGLHPTQKPVDLFRYLIRTYTNLGDVVLDNCAGSGTTAVAAIREQRDFIVIERDAVYYGIASKRIADEQAQLRLFSEVSA